MKKFMFFSFIIAAFLLITPTVSAQDEYGVVTDITKSTGDSLTSGSGTIKTEGNTTTIRYSASEFKMLEADPDAAGGERPGPAAWIGFEVAKPKNDTDSSYKVTTPDNKTEQLKTYPYKDYVGITPDNLKKVLLKGTVLTYKYSFDWNEDNKDDQFVIIEIDPKGITLTSEKGNDSVWTPDIAQKILSEQNPNTKDINLYLIIGLIITGVLGLIYCFKKA